MVFEQCESWSLASWHLGILAAEKSLTRIEYWNLLKTFMMFLTFSKRWNLCASIILNPVPFAQLQLQ